MLRSGIALPKHIFPLFLQIKMPPLVHFLHGKESGPWGSKITYLADIVKKHGADVESLDYSATFDTLERVRILEQACAARPAAVLVGSSMGGWVATTASARIKVSGLFLLAPAFYLPDYPQHQVGCSGDKIEIVHGWHDSVVPYRNSVRFGQENNCTLHLVDDEHRLRNRLDRVGLYLSSFLERILK